MNTDACRTISTGAMHQLIDIQEYGQLLLENVVESKRSQGGEMSPQAWWNPEDTSRPTDHDSAVSWSAVRFFLDCWLMNNELYIM
jgi:hypothetical protein